jgi:DNA-binding IclR family transcriptional regulator
MTRNQAAMLRMLLLHPGADTPSLAGLMQTSYGTTYDRLTTLARLGWASRTPLDHTPVTWTPTQKARELHQKEAG